MHLEGLKRLLENFRRYKDLPYCFANTPEMRQLPLVQYYRDMQEIIKALEVAIKQGEKEKTKPVDIVGNHAGTVAKKCLQRYIDSIEGEKPKKPIVTLNKENLAPPRNKLIRTHSIGNISSLMFAKPPQKQNVAPPHNKLVRSHSMGSMNSLMFAKPFSKLPASDLKRNRENEINNVGSVTKRLRLTPPTPAPPIISPYSFSLVKKTACYAQAAFQKPDPMKTFEYLFELLGKAESKILLEILEKAVNSNDTRILRHELKFDPTIDAKSALFHYGTQAFKHTRVIFLTCIAKKTFTDDFHVFKTTLENYCRPEPLNSYGLQP